MDTQRIEMLIGAEALNRLQKARVAVLGLGGVGSYVAEALVRSGVGTVRIIDKDVVDSSNANRQLPALTSTIGQSKVSVMAARLRDINPQCHLETYEGLYEAGHFTECLPGEWDYIVDAIDDLKAKIDLIGTCYEENIPLISAMGTGNKLNPSLLKISDISKTSVCPLARNVRRELRQRGITKGVEVVFSTELPQKKSEGYTPASMVFVPASAGLLMASWVVRKLISTK